MTSNQFILGIISVTLILFVGCDTGPRLVPVSGIVTIDGKPLKKGLVTVFVKETRPAYGKIGPDGKFHLMTKVEGDGCAIGEHSISVLSRDPLGPEAMRHLIPERYGNDAISDLKIKIDGPTENLEIKLTWEGSGHKEAYITGDVSKSKEKEK